MILVYAIMDLMFVDFKGRCIDCLKQLSKKTYYRCLKCRGRFFSNEKNKAWKGNNVGYNGLHQWVRRKLFKRATCEICRQAPAFEVANISQQYKRDLSDWEWVCRKCHVAKDKRLIEARKALIDIKMKRNSKGQFIGKI